MTYWTIRKPTAPRRSVEATLRADYLTLGTLNVHVKLAFRFRLFVHNSNGGNGFLRLFRKNGLNGRLFHCGGKKAVLRPRKPWRRSLGM